MPVAILMIPVFFVVGDQKSLSRKNNSNPSHFPQFSVTWQFSSYSPNVHGSANSAVGATHFLRYLEDIFICVGSIHDEWSSAELHNHYRYFYVTFVVGALA
jgi:hypothetical protein